GLPFLLFQNKSLICGMRAVVQRVTQASCTVDGICTGVIEGGLLVLLCIAEDDTETELEWVAQKMVNLRIFSDDVGLMNISVRDIGMYFVLISHFTLRSQMMYWDRQCIMEEPKPNKGEPFYVLMGELLSLILCNHVVFAVFGADMKIDLGNDVPVTIILA